MNSPVLTIKSMNKIVSKNLSKKEFKANLKWLNIVHATLKEGGSWAYPDSGIVFIKKDRGFYFDTSKTPAGA